jgi:hypothetical protein
VRNFTYLQIGDIVDEPRITFYVLDKHYGSAYQSVQDEIDGVDDEDDPEIRLHRLDMLRDFEASQEFLDDDISCPTTDVDDRDSDRFPQINENQRWAD